MKTIRLILIAIAMLSIPQGAFAQGTPVTPIQVAVFPDGLPALGNPALFRGSVLRKTTRGTISAYSQSETPTNDTLDYANVTGTDADDVIAKLKQVAFKFKVASTVDNVSVWANLETGDWQGVGGGGGQVNLIHTTDGKWVIDPASHFFLDTYEQLPLFVGYNTTEVRILIHSADGSLFEDYIQVYGGWAYLPLSYSGKIGNIILIARNGNNVSSQAYTLAGTAVTASQVIGSVDLALTNYRKVTDAGLALNATLTAEIYPALPVGTTEANNAPVITVKLASARTVLCYSAIVAPGTNTVWQTPRQGWYWSNDDALPHAFSITPGTFAPLTLPAGNHTIMFDFGAFDRTPQPPYYGKG